MPLHKLLSRQLGKLKLDESKPPSDINEWQLMLEHVNKTYEESDRDRYLLERSMEISSREMMDLNHKLESAQQIAHLGYWSHDISTGKNTWSKELYKMFELDYAEPAPDLEKIYQITHDQDRQQLKELIEKALAKGEEYSIEMQMKSLGSEEYRWYHVVGQPVKTQHGPIHQLIGIALDITNRKKIEAEVSSLNHQLLSSARRAGMADVATSILHNIGNTLNSANVSIGLIQENMNQPYFNKLFALQDLFNKQFSHLSEFITNDPKGKLILPYLIELIKKIKTIHTDMIQEVIHLKNHIEHIKDISAMQKLVSGMSAIVEKIFLPEIIDNAIQMVGELEKNKINLTKDYQEKFFIMTDKSKVLQILVNIIQNARDALSNNPPLNKEISISVKKPSETSCQIIIKDNGIGIEQSNLIKIFSLGFTTKEKGHGYGLHSSALTAKELGGDLKVKSKGYHHGATFILTLPLTIGSTRRSLHEDAEKQLENISD